MRSGVLEGLGTFTIHGRGCRFELASGEDADVDRDDDGRADSGSWRVTTFARSIGEMPAEQQGLRRAPSEVGAIVALGPDTFTWPHGRTRWRGRTHGRPAAYGRPRLSG